MNHLGQGLPPPDERGRGLEGELGLHQQGPEDGRDVEVVLGAALHVPVLPVAEHGGLGLLPGDLPGQVGLVADDHQGELLASLLVHEVPQPGHLVEGGEVVDAVDEEHGVGGGEGAGEHRRELVHVAAAGVLDVQAEGGAEHLAGGGEEQGTWKYY